MGWGVEGLLRGLKGLADGVGWRGLLRGLKGVADGVGGAEGAVEGIEGAQLIGGSGGSEDSLKPRFLG